MSGCSTPPSASVERSLAKAAARKSKRGLVLAEEDLRLAASTFITEDPRSAQTLLDAKRELNAIERATSRRHLNRLEARAPGGLEASTLHLAILRDLRRVNSHVSAIAYDVLGLADPLENQNASSSAAADQTAEVDDPI